MAGIDPPSEDLTERIRARRALLRKDEGQALPTVGARPRVVVEVGEPPEPTPEQIEMENKTWDWEREAEDVPFEQAAAKALDTDRGAGSPPEGQTSGSQPVEPAPRDTEHETLLEAAAAAREELHHTPRPRRKTASEEAVQELTRMVDDLQADLFSLNQELIDRLDGLAKGLVLIAEALSKQPEPFEFEDLEVLESTPRWKRWLGA